MKIKNPSSRKRARGAVPAAHESFYRAFEERFRGSRELIRSRLLVYLPFIAPLKTIYKAPRAVDLGCGRGEWLELLGENGFDAQGVDLDDGMLAACHERGLRTARGDAVAFLKRLPGASQAIVSGFHIAEHLPFPALQTLVQEALRVLKPAGLLILETPNPENFNVASLTFYLDPTHRRPLPPDLLSFLPEHYGFARTKVLRLQERPDLSQSDASLEQVLSGPSPDYAVVAQKRARKTADARLFDEAFNKEFGIGANALVSRFDRRLAEQHQKTAALEARINEEHSAWVESLHKQLLAKSEALVRRAAELAHAREALAASHEWGRSLQGALAAKNDALAEREAEASRLREALAASQSHAKSLQAELAQTSQALAESDRWAKSLEADLIAAREALAAQGVELEKTREALAEGDAELAREREDLADSRSWAKSLEADLAAKAEEFAERFAELTHAREALAASDARLKSLEADLAAKNGALAARNAELVHTKEALAKAEAWAQSLSAHVEALGERQRELTNTLDSIRATVEKRGLKRHLKRLERSIRKRRDRLRERLKKIERSIRKRRDRFLSSKLVSVLSRSKSEHALDSKDTQNAGEPCAAGSDVPVNVKIAPLEDAQSASPSADDRDGMGDSDDIAAQNEKEQIDAALFHEPLDVRLAYRRLRAAGDNLERATPPRGPRPRLAYVSPLPPEKTGIADYSAELLPALSAHYDVDAVVAAPPEQIPAIGGCQAVRDVAWFAANAHAYNRIVYHIGNSPFHHHMFPLLEKYPGVVVLHDFYLGHLMAFLERQGGWRGYWTRELCHSHGYEAVQRRFLPGKTADVVRAFPVNLSILQQGQGVIVHSDFSRALARRFYGEGFADDWAVIPHVRRLPENVDRAAARAALGVHDGDFLVCSFGFLGENKLNHRLLDCWLASRLADKNDCRLVFVGDAPLSHYCDALRAAISQSSARANIRITGYASPELYRQYLAAADAAVQLRCQSRGETSGTVLDCMAHGAPLIVNAHGSMAELPDAGVIKLADDFSDHDLVSALESLEAHKDRRRELGDRARRTIAEEFAPANAALRYRDAIERFAAGERSLFDIRALSDIAADLVRTDAAGPAWIDEARVLAQQSPPRHPRQLLVDVSALAHEDLRTGIQRVARAQLMCLLEVPPEGFRVEPVRLCEEGGRWRCRYARRFTSKLLGIPSDDLSDDPVSVSSGDVYYMPDHLAHGVARAAASGLYAEWRALGVETNFVVYDNLPILRPEFFPQGADAIHGEWLRRVSEGADRLVCISQDVADSTRKWLETHEPTVAHPDILALHLGADLDASAPTIGLPETAPAVLEALASRPTFLMVGTIEPRKGYLQTLDAFDALWREGIDVNLVIVGAEGWKPLSESQRRDIPRILARLRGHAQLGRRLFWLDGVSDEYLEQLYRAATCLLVASEGEGFGLPLIEAAKHHVPILARGIPVFREVAGEHAAYFEGLQPADLANALKNWLALYAQGRHPQSDNMPWISWKENVERLKGILLRNVGVN